jgi:hypothetical protein
MTVKLTILDPPADVVKCSHPEWSRTSMTISAEISIGEFLDKMTILEIKSSRIRSESKLANVRRELETLQKTWYCSPCASVDTRAEYGELLAVNEQLWEVEDRIREKESAGSFDEGFIDLARSVYRLNDRRAAIKRNINLKLDSGFIEEKSYSDYSPKTPGKI